MNLFDQLVEQAMQSEASLGTVRAAVEKELLHHDILREMSRAGLLKGLTFIGGTCLRACYGSPRLSEDLDFTGGTDFAPDYLEALGPILEATLMEKYGLPASVNDPIREGGNVSTWRIRMQTRLDARHLPAQRIHIDICALPSHQARPALLRNSYGVDMGTDGLIMQAQSREEILADKWVALAFRPNRVQYRDLWDILWLHRERIDLLPTLVHRKIQDRQRTPPAFQSALRERIDDLECAREHPPAFRKEMDRFLPATAVQELLHQPEFWTLLMRTLRDQAGQVSID